MYKDKNKHNEYNRKQYQKDKEKIKIHKKADRQENPEKYRERKKEYDKKHSMERREYHRKYHQEHKEELRDYRFKFKYGIDLDVYNEIFNKQNGCCAICSIHQSELSRALFVDHNHETKKVRGLLCSSCNAAIGMLKDDINVFQEAIKYLEENE